MEWFVGAVSILGGTVVLIQFIRTVLRDRASLRVTGQCQSNPGCTVLEVKAVKVGMTPLQLEYAGLMWGRFPWRLGRLRLPWGRFPLIVYQVFAERRSVTLSADLDPSAVFQWTPPPPAKTFRAQFDDHAVIIVTASDVLRPRLTFHGEVYTEALPMELFAEWAVKHGKPDAVVVTTANSRHFVGSVPGEVWDGLQVVAARRLANEAISP